MSGTANEDMNESGNSGNEEVIATIKGQIDDNPIHRGVAITPSIQ